MREGSVIHEGKETPYDMCEVIVLISSKVTCACQLDAYLTSLR